MKRSTPVCFLQVSQIARFSSSRLTRVVIVRLAPDLHVRVHVCAFLSCLGQTVSSWGLVSRSFCVRQFVFVLWRSTVGSQWWRLQLVQDVTRIRTKTWTLFLCICSPRYELTRNRSFHLRSLQDPPKYRPADRAPAALPSPANTLIRNQYLHALYMYVKP